MAMATPWDILLSPPFTSWRGEIVLHTVVRIRAASIPVESLKSTFNSDSFLLSEIRRLFAFMPGLLPNNINEVRWQADGLAALNTARST